LSCTASCSSRSFRRLELGDVGERADEAHHLAVGADHRPRPQHDPTKCAVGGAQAELLHEAAAAMLHHGVEGGADAVAVGRVQRLDELGGDAFERAALQAELRLELRPDPDAVGADVPVEDDVAGP
jgi:hypothetical protein